MTRGYVRSNVRGMATPTVKLVADVSPALKNGLDRIAKARKITRRQAVEDAITAYIDAAVDAANGRREKGAA